MILKDIYEEIQSRKENPVENSYINYLQKEGVKKICKKIGEEASEAIIEAVDNDREGLIKEISDLVFHTLVLMHEKGITLQDIADKLAERALKKGNLKQKKTSIGFEAGIP